ncbi:DUF547 domain-containing protein [Colwellia sp. E2M01]|uniref:DUF547 domain-containing protein n=1 Tax=Colwellia sp. E2M01 TaxID=2841561 RepID=UPI001C07F657|nr:DUF547 domain-containing protein [Colwellia sp. E2M01]MBU2870093.1 DUF547 domain-containing protein [Colwellia sp. E2M01]
MLKVLTLGLALLAISFVGSAQNTISNASNTMPVAVKGMHDSWSNLLNNNVITINNGHSTAVDYLAMQKQHTELTDYLAMLTAVTQSEFDSWNKPKQLAFLINAYNAWTVGLIVSNLNSKDNATHSVKSIKDLGSFFSSPWNKDFIPLLGKIRSLNDIEHGLIRGAVDKQGNATYNDPRIHFAVNCASIGCPALREEAYTGDKLRQQLEQQTVRFLSDSSRNFAKGDNLNVSSIFKWYGDDFTKGFNNANSLEAFFLLYGQALNLTLAQKQALNSGDMDINFLDYNWDLNSGKTNNSDLNASH